MIKHIFSKTTFVLIAFIFFNQTIQGQWYDPEKVNKKAKPIYLAAYDFAMAGEYVQAIDKLNAAIKIEPKYVEAYLSRAGIYAEMKNYELSVKDFYQAFSMDSLYAKEYLLPYSISLAGIGKFEDAVLKVDAFLLNEKLNERSIKSGRYRKSVYEFAIQYKKDHASENYVFGLSNLGDSINSNYLEYYPSITIDGKKMIFTRRVNDDEDFYESEYINQEWTKAKPVPGKINTTLNEGAQNISQDGNWLIFTGCNYPEGLGSCDLYISYRMKNGNWTEAENLGSIINTESWESAPALSPDKKDLYFSSNRPGGMGGRDIWVSHRLPTGKWTAPENLGPTVNTKADESCPFLHSDNQTLYFNSNGHMGYGMTDLFLSRKDSNNKWRKPENLGYPINTIDDEGSLIVASDGKTAYYASDRLNKKSGLDIYAFQLRNDIQAIKTIWINGSVFDKKTNQGLPCQISLTDINNRNKSTQVQTDEEGNFMVTLPIGSDYALHVNRKGYLFYSANFSIPLLSTDSFLNVKIPLQPLEQGASIVLKNIFFDNKSFELKKASEEELNTLTALMQENPKMTLQISGHTDNVGKKEDNLLLSQNRAKAVVNYLISKGITASRLVSKGFGDTMPMDKNDTEQGKINNRRTEINILSN